MAHGDEISENEHVGTVVAGGLAVRNARMRGSAAEAVCRVLKCLRQKSASGRRERNGDARCGTPRLELVSGVAVLVCRWMDCVSIEPPGWYVICMSRMSVLKNQRVCAWYIQDINRVKP